jgi:hypothetical protein
MGSFSMLVPWSPVGGVDVPDLAALAPSHASPQRRAQLRETVRAWNAAIAAAARPHGQRVLVVDLVPASKQLPQHAEWVSADGFHPSPEGYQKLAALTLEAMHRAGIAAAHGRAGTALMASSGGAAGDRQPARC